tara:strand:+ start:1132 stop:1506 length:375 start_codon:yes stop_codon:yes gene_type:complete
MFTVTKEFKFEAAHSLPHLGPENPCSRIHGHSYRFVVECTGETDSRGFVIDYSEISQCVDPIVEKLDHQYLNDVLPGRPTTENVARWLFNQIQHRIPILSGIVVFETAKTSVIYRPNSQEQAQP